MLTTLFEPSLIHKSDNFWRTTDIQAELRNHLKACDVPNLTILGLAIKKLKWPRGSIHGIRGYYLQLKKTSTTKKQQG